MPDNRNGPPGGRDGEGGHSSPEKPATVEQEPTASSAPQPHDNRAHRQCRRNTVGRCAGVAWREGFGYGFRDALRLAQRELDDPHAWAVLDRIADQYELAGDS
jgi:hypothetical protein